MLFVVCVVCCAMFCSLVDNRWFCLLHDCGSSFRDSCLLCVGWFVFGVDVAYCILQHMSYLIDARVLRCSLLVVGGCSFVVECCLLCVDLFFVVCVVGVLCIG